MMRFVFTASAMLAFAASTNAQTATEHIASGDRDYLAMRAEPALSHYEQAAKIDQSSYEASWKASRSAVDIGSYSNDKSRREALFASAEQYARRAVQLNPGEAEGHFSLARALGKTALTQSPKVRIRYATEIRSQALECLRLNPRHGGCLHVMGMWNAEVMRLSSLTRERGCRHSYPLLFVRCLRWRPSQRPPWRGRFVMSCVRYPRGVG